MAPAPAPVPPQPNPEVLAIMNWANRLDERTLILACTHAAHGIATGAWPSGGDLRPLRDRIRRDASPTASLAATVAGRLTITGRAKRLLEPQLSAVAPIAGALHRLLHDALLAAYARTDVDATENDWLAPLDAGYRATRRLCDAAADLTDDQTGTLTRLIGSSDAEPEDLVAAVRALD